MNLGAAAWRKGGEEFCSCSKKPGGVFEVDDLESMVHLECGKKIEERITSRGPVVVDHIISKIPKEWRRWCGPTPENQKEDGPVLACACQGCVNNIGAKITWEEWSDWKSRHAYCESCGRMDG